MAERFARKPRGVNSLRTGPKSMKSRNTKSIECTPVVQFAQHWRKPLPPSASDLYCQRVIPVRATEDLIGSHVRTDVVVKRPEFVLNVAELVEYNNSARLD